MPAPTTPSFAPGEVLKAADLNQGFASVTPTAGANLTPVPGWDNVPTVQVAGATAANAPLQALADRTETLNPDSVSAVPSTDGTEAFVVKKSGNWFKLTLTNAMTWGVSVFTSFTQVGAGAVARTLLAKLLDFAPNFKDFGGSTGASDNSTALTNLINTNRATTIGEGTYNVATGFVSATQSISLRGSSQAGTTLKQTSATVPTILSTTGTSGSAVRHLTLDVTTNGASANGFPLNYTDVNDSLVENVTVNGLTGQGSGFFASTLSNAYMNNVRFHQLKVVGNLANASNTNGALMVGAQYSMMRGIYADSIHDFAVEYKNQCQYSLMSDIIVNNSAAALEVASIATQSQTSCVFTNIIAKDCSYVLGMGKATYNAFSNAVCSIQTPFTGGVNKGIITIAGADYNAFRGFLFTGSFALPVQHAAKYNYTDGEFHTTGTILQLDSGAQNNITAVNHPGTRTSILSAITNNSTQPVSGSTSNPVYCHATGEYVGTLSDQWLWRHAASGYARQSSTDKWVYEGAGSVYVNVLADGAGANGFSVSTNGKRHKLDYTWSNDYWTLDALSTFYRWYGFAFTTTVDNVASLGLAATQWTNVFAKTATLSGPIALAAPTTQAGATYSQLTSDSSLIFNGTATQTLTLLAPATYPGRILHVKNTAAFAVNSASSNVVPLAGGSAGTAILAAGPGKWATLQSDGANWVIMAAN